MWSCISPMTNDMEHLFMCLFSGPELEWGNRGNQVQTFRRHLFSGSGPSVEPCRHHTCLSLVQALLIFLLYLFFGDVSIESFTLFFLTVNFFLLGFESFLNIFDLSPLSGVSFAKKKIISQSMVCLFISLVVFFEEQLFLILLLI